MAFEDVKDIKLFTDADEITHWRYGMTGVLVVCGMYRKPGYLSVVRAEHPTCLRCIALVQTNRHTGEQW